METLQILFNFLLQIPQILAVHASGFQYIGAGLAVFTGFGTAIGQGLIGMKAVEAIGRQPEASGKVTIIMVIAQAVVETAAIYGLIIAFILMGK